MQDLLLHLIVIAPLVAMIFKNPQLTRQMKIIYAVAFLGAVALFTAGYHHYTSTPNLYASLGVSSSVTSHELRRHYLTLVKQLHPDNNPGGSDTLFIQIREAYEMLQNENLRDQYNRFGIGILRAAAKGDDSNSVLMSYAIGAVMYYCIWGFLILVMMRGKAYADGRSWALTALFVLIIIDVQLTFGDLRILTFVLRSATNYDKVQLLRAAFPSIFSACRILSPHLYDTEEEDVDRLVLYQVHDNTKSALALLAHLEEELVTNRSKVAADGTHIPTKPVDADVLARLERARELLGKARETPFRMDAPRKPKRAEAGGGGLMGLVSYLAVPLVLNFLLNK